MFLQNDIISYKNFLINSIMPVNCKLNEGLLQFLVPKWLNIYERLNINVFI